MITTTDATSVHNQVASAASALLYTRRVIMSFNDDESLYVVLAGVKNRLLGNYKHDSYAYYNFPLAFLLTGILDHHVATCNAKSLDIVRHKCEDLLTNTGDLKFNIDKIDQSAFGLVFLQLFVLTKRNLYLIGAHKIYEEIQRFKMEDGLYRYRLGLDVFFIDTVGLLCPFLVRYAEITGNSTAMLDAERQVNFALTECTEPNMGLTFHAFDLVREQPLGSVNWSRGMGWFLLGLSAVARTGENTSHMEVLRRYVTILGTLRESHGYWPQFLGHTNDRVIDSTATLMFLHAFQQCELWRIDSNEVLALTAQCVDRYGRVIHASGDTIYINKYSRHKGPSELSQGLMLSILAKMNQ